MHLFFIELHSIISVILVKLIILKYLEKYRGRKEFES